MTWNSVTEADALRMLQSVVATLPLAAGLSDGTGRLHYLNDTFARLLASSPVARRIRSVLSEQARAAVASLNNEPSSLEPPVPSAHGRTTTVVDCWRLHALIVPGLHMPTSTGAVIVCAEMGGGTQDHLRSIGREYGLTERELQIAALLTRGYSCKSVAGALSISPHTVRRHTESVQRKLYVHSRAELVLRVTGAPSNRDYLDALSTRIR